MYDYLISCISWEDRFISGTLENIKKFDIRIKEFLVFNTYESEKNSNILKARELSDCQITEIDFGNSLNIWNILKAKFYNDTYLNKKVLLDITTMPRETIWLILLFLNQKTQDIDFIYYKPLSYAQEGLLSYNPMSPRLIYKMSGISDISKQTMMIVTAGFDFERIDAIKNKFEPAKLFILYDFNSKLCDKLEKKYPNDILIKIDAYDTDKLYTHLKDILVEYNPNKEYNVVCASLGPKPTAISFYRLWKEYPYVALSYTPSKNYNMEYSKGLGDSISGRV